MKNVISIFLALALIACDNQDSSAIKDYTPEELLGKTVEEYEELETQRQQKPKKKEDTEQSKTIKNGYLQLAWEDLVAPGYDPETILAKYEPLVDKIEHGSDEALELYLKMEEEFNNAPPNKNLADKKVSVPGFIAPLEQNGGIITEFLLVPYFGACIHLPPPPANQTVYVKVAPDYGIKIEDSYEPIWVSGELLVNSTSTDIGAASYEINDALISVYF